MTGGIRCIDFRQNPRNAVQTTKKQVRVMINKKKTTNFKNQLTKPVHTP